MKIGNFFKKMLDVLNPLDEIGALLKSIVKGKDIGKSLVDILSPFDELKDVEKDIGRGAISFDRANASVQNGDQISSSAQTGGSSPVLPGLANISPTLPMRDEVDC